MSGAKSSPTRVIELAANLDDVTGQVLGDAQRRLLDAGALDVWTTAIGMKKQRPGVMLSLLCEPAKRDTLAAMILELTGSMGVRHREWGRLVLKRRHETVRTRFGAVRVKVGSLRGRVVSAQPEYDDAERLAAAKGVPLRTVLRAAQVAAEALFGKE
ncbi:MAG: LarC family nickel insertion protein [Planctomycetes bacterium]|nr:LarC family nickel insertion protein [Planctomycetota bacterium]